MTKNHYNRYREKAKNMKKIQVMHWIEPEPDPDHPGKAIDVEYNTTKIISALIGLIPAQEMPRGRTQFKLMNKINLAFEEVERKLANEEPDIFLYLEDNEYDFIKGIYDKDIPAAWGRSRYIAQCFDLFDKAENFDPNTDTK